MHLFLLSSHNKRNQIRVFPNQVIEGSHFGERPEFGLMGSKRNINHNKRNKMKLSLKT